MPTIAQRRARSDAPYLWTMYFHPCVSVVYSLAVCTGRADKGTRSLVLVKYSADHSFWKSTTGFLPTSYATREPVGSDRASRSSSFISTGSQRTTVQGAASSRDTAPYSLSRRNCTTSNCNGPTAASNGVFTDELRRYNACMTPSCINWSSPCRNCLNLAVLGLCR